MTLPSSGPLTLANIQTEFGGSNPISLSEYYAGGAYVPAGTSGTYGAVPSSGTISIRNFYGTSKILDTQTVTRGTASTGSDPYYNWAGYSGTGSPTFGSISDGTSNIYSGATINGLYFYEAGSSGTFGYYDRYIAWVVNGTQSNSGWSTITIGSTTYNRVDASFSTSGGVSTWIWFLAIPNPLVSGSPGPFTATTTVTWA